jgi:LPXTG-motif cell wall-anchored protein
MTKGSAALGLAVLLAAIVAGGQVAAQAQSRTSRAFPTSLHTGKARSVPAGGTTMVRSSDATDSPFAKSECKNRGLPGDGVRLRLVHGSTFAKGAAGPGTVISETGPFPVSAAGAWSEPFTIPRLAAPGNDTIEASCNGFPSAKKDPTYSDGAYIFPVKVTAPVNMPNTGFAAWPWTILGAALLAVGAVLLGAGRRRGGQRAVPGTAGR